VNFFGEPVAIVLADPEIVRKLRHYQSIPSISLPVSIAAGEGYFSRMHARGLFYCGNSFMRCKKQFAKKDGRSGQGKLGHVPSN
jgi:hypothetical protein